MVMDILIAAIAVLLAFYFIWFWSLLKHAPNGWEDKNGFHYGEQKKK